MAQGINTAFEIAGSKGGITVQVSLSEQYEALQNVSDLTVGLQVKSSQYYDYTYYLKGSLKVDGVELVKMQSTVPTHYVKPPAKNTYDPVKKWSASYTDSPWTITGLQHSTDGSKTVTLSLELTGYTGGGGGGSGWNVSITKEIPLTHIPRASTIAATDANIGAVSMVAVTRRSAEYTHTIHWTFGELSGYLTADGGTSETAQKISATSIPFRLPSSFYEEIPNSASGICTLTCTTYLGSTAIGNAQTTTFAVTANKEICRPSVSGSVKDTNPETIALTGDDSILVRFASTAFCSISATAKNGATIVKRTVNGATAQNGELTIQNIQTPQFVFAAEDSRGFAGQYSATAEMIDYLPIVLNIFARRNDPTSGGVVLEVDGTCFSGSFGTVDNAVTATYQINSDTAQNLPITVEDNAFRLSLELTGLDYRESHTITVTVSDKIQTVTKSVPIGKGIPVFNWGENHFQFNVPVSAPSFNGATSGNSGSTVRNYGAVGDGTTDDTSAFQSALTAERVVFVPGGTYVLSGTIVIAENCCLELSQDTVLQFTQTSGNCIEIRSSATLRGNHAIISVPYGFTGNAISIDTEMDGTTSNNVTPYKKWDPQFKRQRFVYDVNIVKPDSAGFHVSDDGICTGTAIYMSAEGTTTNHWMWAIVMSGIRIAGGFSYGIRAKNIDVPGDPEDDAWNHDMRIEAVIESCEIGVALENCNSAHLAVTIQPRPAQNTNAGYAKYGFYLNDAKYIDMSQCAVWDWNKDTSLHATGNQYQHIAMFGNCKGLVLGDFTYYAENTDIRSRIYTDTPANFDSMVILQEPITRWFKPLDAKPYFDNGSGPERLILQSDLDTYFDTERIQAFTDALATATDAYNSSTVFNGIGYIRSGYRLKNDGTLEANTYYGCTGFIPCAKGDTLYIKDIVIHKNEGNCLLMMYDKNGTKLRHLGGGSDLITTGNNYYATYTVTDDGCEIYFKSKDADGWDINDDLGYIRIGTLDDDFGPQPVISVNNEIGYQQEGFLQESVKVKGESIILSSPGGKSYKLTVNNSGGLSTVEIT